MALTETPVRVSVVICTHNPDWTIFSKCLDSVKNLRWPDGDAKEIIIVDNHSEVALDTNVSLLEWISNTQGARLLREPCLGLSHARARAFREANAEIIVCCDDDNAPNPDYVEQALVAFSNYPWVGVWGPGHIELEWGAGSDVEVMRRHAGEFQYHYQKHVSYGVDFPALKTMPYGTGMVLRKSVALVYAEHVESGALKTTGRQGKQLTSGEDNQIDWLAMRHGWAIGRHPDLKLTHIISSARAQSDYVSRLAYGKAKSYLPALREVLPEYFKARVPGSFKVFLKVCGKASVWLFSSNRNSLGYQLARTLGEAVGAWDAHSKAPPAWVRKLVKVLYGEAI